MILATLIIINGEEEFLKERAAFSEVQNSLVNSVNVYQGNTSEYLEDISLNVFGGEIRAFIIFNCKDIPDIPSNDDILVCVSEKKKKLEHPRANKILNFPELKTFGNNNEVIQWIIDEGDNLNMNLRRVASALFVNSGKSLRKLSSEIRKLSVLVPEGQVTPEVAKSVMCFTASVTPKDVVDSICDGNTVRAIAFYDKLQEKADETGWIIAFLQRLLIQQLRMEFFLNDDIDESSIADKLGIHKFHFKKLKESRHKIWSIGFLKRSLNTLCELDLFHKKGDIAAKPLLELEIIKLSEEAKHGIGKHR